MQCQVCFTYPGEPKASSPFPWIGTHTKPCYYKVFNTIAILHHLYTDMHTSSSTLGSLCVEINPQIKIEFDEENMEEHEEPVIATDSNINNHTILTAIPKLTSKSMHNQNGEGRGTLRPHFTNTNVKGWGCPGPSNHF